MTSVRIPQQKAREAARIKCWHLKHGGSPNWGTLAGRGEELEMMNRPNSYLSARIEMNWMGLAMSRCISLPGTALQYLQNHLSH